MVTDSLIKYKTQVTIVLLMLFVITAIAALWVTAIPQSTDRSSAKTSATTTTAKKHSATAAAAETTTTSTSTTTTTRPATTTTTLAVTTTAGPTFSATTSALLSDEHTVQCISDTYTFSGTIQANTSGTVSYKWIRFDDADTGVEGTLTFGSDGTTTGSVTPYVFTQLMTSDYTGWVALQATWVGGSHTSSHAAFTFNGYYVNTGIHPSGC